MALQLPYTGSSAAAVSVINDGESVIPGFACLKPTSYTRNSAGQWLVSVVQPDQYLSPLYLVNSAVPIQPGGGTGTAKERGVAYVSYSTAAGEPTPTLGCNYGPVANSWLVKANRPGFFTYGAFTNTGPEGHSGINIVPVKSYLITQVWVKLTASLSSGGSLANQPVYTGVPAAAGGPEADSGLKIAFLYASPNLSGSLASGTFVLCEYIDGYWYAASSTSSCPNMFENVSGTDIPPYAVMRVTGSSFNGTTPCYTVDQSNGTEPIGMKPIYIVNGPTAVPANDSSGYGRTFGNYQNCDKVWVQYNTPTPPTGIPVTGETYGPPSGEWYVDTAYPGFTCLGLQQTGVTVQDAAGDNITVNLMLVKQNPKRSTTMFQLVDTGGNIAQYGTMRPRHEVDAIITLNGHAVWQMVNIGYGSSVSSPPVFERVTYVNGEEGAGVYPGVVYPRFGNFQDGERIWVQYNADAYGDPVYGENWGPTPNQNYVVRNFYGYKYEGVTTTVSLTSVEDGNPTDTTLMLVSRDPPTEIWVKTSATLDQGGICNGKVYTSNSPADPTIGTDTGFIVEDITDTFLQSGASLPSGSLILCRYAISRWWAVGYGGCPSGS